MERLIRGNGKKGLLILTAGVSVTTGLVTSLYLPFYSNTAKNRQLENKDGNQGNLADDERQSIHLSSI